MSYILKFVPLNNSVQFAGVGMAGNIMIILNELLSISDGSRVYVEMNDYENISGSEKNINHWSLYFDQIDKPSESTIIELKPPRPTNIIYKHNYSNSDKIMVRANKSFFNNFKVNSKIEDKINEFYNTNIKGIETLSCQIRLGDMVKNHNTASIDMNAGNFFTVTLANSATTHFNVTNLNPGENANIFVTTGTISSASFSTNIKQPSGSAYLPSSGSGVIDVLSLVALNSTNAYIVNAKRFI